MPPKRSRPTFFPAQTGLVERVKVRQDGTEVSVLTGVVALAGSPRGSDVNAKMLLETDHVAVDIDIGAAFFRRINVAIVGIGRQKCAAADHDIPLLGKGELGEEEESANGCEDR